MRALYHYSSSYVMTERTELIGLIYNNRWQDVRCLKIEMKGSMGTCVYCVCAHIGMFF